jgi:hypothetical protein
MVNSVFVPGLQDVCTISICLPPFETARLFVWQFNRGESKQERALTEISASLAPVAGKAIFVKTIRIAGK